eukprot:5215549-Alexandrium_andersonii.AAC.1
MSASLVGSEMCIRDRTLSMPCAPGLGKPTPPSSGGAGSAAPGPATGPTAYMSSMSGCVPGTPS